MASEGLCSRIGSVFLLVAATVQLLFTLEVFEDEEEAKDQRPGERLDALENPYVLVLSRALIDAKLSKPLIERLRLAGLNCRVKEINKDDPQRSKFGAAVLISARTHLCSSAHAVQGLDNALFNMQLSGPRGELANEASVQKLKHGLESLTSEHMDLQRTLLLPFCCKHGLVPRVLLMHDLKASDRLFKMFEGESSSCATKLWQSSVNIEEIRSYLGDELALYFEFLRFYTNLLTLPALLGAVRFLVQFWYPQDMRMSLLHTLLMPVWGMLFLRLWKQHESRITNQWEGSESSSVDSSHHAGENMEGSLVAVSAGNFFGHATVKREMLKEEVIWRRVTSHTVSLALLIGLAFCDWQILQWQLRTNKWISDPAISSSMGVVSRLVQAQAPTISKAVFIAVAGMLFDKISRLLVRFERHTIEDDAHTSLVVKLCGFRFFSSFLYLFFIAFVEQDMGKLKTSLYTVLLVSLFIQNFVEFIMPIVTERLQLARELHAEHKLRHDKARRRLRVNRVTRALRRADYVDSFDDYTEIFIQWGQVIMFAPVFPLGALFALINNVLEGRGDAYKVLRETNRPRPVSACSIGVWSRAFELLLLTGVASNVALLSLYSGDKSVTVSPDQQWSSPLSVIFPELDTVTEQIMSMVALEHLIFVIIYIVAYSISVRAISAEQRQFPTRDIAKKTGDEFKEDQDPTREMNINTEVVMNESSTMLSSAEQLCYNAVSNSQDRARMLKLIRKQHELVTTTLRVRDEAIAFASEAVPSEIILRSLPQSFTVVGK